MGPVVAAAVILDELNPIQGLADSKKLTALRREKLYDEIRAKALCCSIALASAEEIDSIEAAFSREKQIQGWSRAKKRALIESRWDELPVLASRAWRNSQSPFETGARAPSSGTELPGP
jgi:ribonuclease HII